jgi:carotenoid 1,2-hydratase
MNILPGIHHDTAHELTAPGAYEWWYVDAISDDGEWACTAIWFIGIPMSPFYNAAFERFKKSGESPPCAHDFPGYSISLYHRGKRVYNAFHEFPPNAFKTKFDEPFIEIGKTRFFFKNKKFEIEIDTVFEKEPRGFKGKFTLTPNQLLAGNSFKNEENGHNHTWIPAAPDCAISSEFALYEYGELKISDGFHGTAYHDHNIGLRPLADDFSDWYWGRVHCGDFTLVYYYAFSPENIPNLEWLGVFKNGELLQIENVKFELNSFKTNAMGLKSAWEITARGFFKNEEVSFKCLAKSVLEYGPFYLRFLSEFEVNFCGKVFKNGGITEFIACQKLRSKLIRPFIKVPIQRKSSHD